MVYDNRGQSVFEVYKDLWKSDEKGESMHDWVRDAYKLQNINLEYKTIQRVKIAKETKGNRSGTIVLTLLKTLD